MSENYGHGDLSWFKHDRFGMFIHYGLYSMPARHEWIRSIEQYKDEDYHVFFKYFNPDLFEPQVWAKAAREAGMKYVVFTTKHHEGFCMWDTKYTDFKITNTPFGRDMLREVVDAFRAEGIRIGFYYSLIDWNHPDFTVDCFHPRKCEPKEVVDKLNEGRDMKRYQDYMINQITELLTNYGKIDVMWFDFSYPENKFPDGREGGGKGHKDWDSERIIKTVRSLQPHIIVDNRLDLPGSGDILTPEQYTPTGNVLEDNRGDDTIGAWDGCQTFSGSWGYHRDEMTWKSDEQCIKMLIDHVSRDGNLLMNVGPTSRGYLDYRAMDRLSAYANWMRYNSRSIYGCGQAPAEFQEGEGYRLTYNKETNRLYIHIYSWPYRMLHVKSLKDKVAFMQLLHDGSELAYSSSEVPVCGGKITHKDDSISIYLPVNKPENMIVPVIEVMLK